MTSDSSVPWRGFHHIALVTPELEATVAFYTGVLGMQAGRIEYYRRDYARAIEELQAVVDREGGFRLAHYYLGLSNGFLGRVAEAEKALAAAGLSGSELRNHIAWVRARNGSPGMAEEILAGEVGGTGALFLAVELERADIAFSLLDAEAVRGTSLLLGLRVDPRFDAIRGDARFSELLRRTDADRPASGSHAIITVTRTTSGRRG